VSFQYGNCFMRVFWGPEILSLRLRIWKNVYTLQLGDPRFVSHRFHFTTHLHPATPHCIVTGADGVVTQTNKQTGDNSKISPKNSV